MRNRWQAENRLFSSGSKASMPHTLLANLSDGNVSVMDGSDICTPDSERSTFFFAEDDAVLDYNLHLGEVPETSSGSACKSEQQSCADAALEALNQHASKAVRSEHPDALRLHKSHLPACRVERPCLEASSASTGQVGVFRNKPGVRRSLGVVGQMGAYGAPSRHTNFQQLSSSRYLGSSVKSQSNSSTTAVASSGCTNACASAGAHSCRSSSDHLSKTNRAGSSSSWSRVSACRRPLSPNHRNSSQSHLPTWCQRPLGSVSSNASNKLGSGSASATCLPWCPDTLLLSSNATESLGSNRDASGPSSSHSASRMAYSSVHLRASAPGFYAANSIRDRILKSAITEQPCEDDAYVSDDGDDEDDEDDPLAKVAAAAAASAAANPLHACNALAADLSGFSAPALMQTQRTSMLANSLPSIEEWQRNICTEIPALSASASTPAMQVKQWARLAADTERRASHGTDTSNGCDTLFDASGRLKSREWSLALRARHSSPPRSAQEVAISEGMSVRYNLMARGKHSVARAAYLNQIEQHSADVIRRATLRPSKRSGAQSTAHPPTTGKQPKPTKPTKATLLGQSADKVSFPDWTVTKPRMPDRSATAPDNGIVVPAVAPAHGQPHVAEEPFPYHRKTGRPSLERLRRERSGSDRRVSMDHSSHSPPSLCNWASSASNEARTSRGASMSRASHSSVSNQCEAPESNEALLQRLIECERKRLDATNLGTRFHDAELLSSLDKSSLALHTAAEQLLSKAFAAPRGSGGSRQQASYSCGQNRPSVPDMLRAFRIHNDENIMAELRRMFSSSHRAAKGGATSSHSA